MYHSMIFTSLNPTQVPTSRTSRLSAYSAMKMFQEGKSQKSCVQHQSDHWWHSQGEGGDRHSGYGERVHGHVVHAALRGGAQHHWDNCWLGQLCLVGPMYWARCMEHRSNENIQLDCSANLLLARLRSQNSTFSTCMNIVVTLKLNKVH